MRLGGPRGVHREASRLGIAYEKGIVALLHQRQRRQVRELPVGDPQFPGGQLRAQFLRQVGEKADVFGVAVFGAEEIEDASWLA
jgi:hypothetical protein